MTALANNAIKAKKPICKRGPRRELPEDLTDLYIADGEQPSALDIVGGRGGTTNYHEGNKRYWRRILVERPGYRQLGKHKNTKKNEIAQAIYDDILSTGGRFLQLDSKTQKWFNLPQKIGLDKIKQALRDKYVPVFLEEGEPVSATPFPAPLPIPLMAPTEGNKKQFLTSFNQAAMPPQADFFSSTSSIDLGPIFSQASSSLDLWDLMSEPSIDQTEGDWTQFPTENRNDMESFEFSLRGDSLENLMNDDLVAACDTLLTS